MNYMLEIGILRNSSQKSFGCPWGGGGGALVAKTM